MPEQILAPVIDHINLFLSNLVKKEENFSSETFETFTRDLSNFLASVGRDLLKLFLELNQPPDNQLEHEGQKYVYKKNVDRAYATLFGKITVSRRVYYNTKTWKKLIPLERSLHMEKQFATVDVCELIGYMSGFLTPKTIHDILSRFGSCPLSQSSIQRIGNAVGKAMETSKEEIIKTAQDQETQLPEGTGVMAVSLDGVNMMLKEPGTLKRRPQTRPGHDLFESGSSCYKNAGIATVSFYKPVTREEKPILQRRRTIVVAHSPEERMKTLKSELELEVRHCLDIAPPDLKKVVVMDGARGLWSYVDNSELFSGWIQIVDFHHCCEHLSKLAEQIFGKSSAKGKSWYSKYRLVQLTEHDGVKKMLRSAKRYLKTMNKPRLLNMLQYFSKNKKRMNYAFFRQEGLPIGSGPVEAACKTIVKARLCCSGMRWTRERAQGILRIRTTIKNNRWDAAWRVCKYKITTSN